MPSHAGSEAVRAAPPAHDDLILRKIDEVRAFYDALGPGRDRWIARSRYYYDGLERLLRFIVPPGRTLLDIGCGNGDLLAALAPELGIGVDVSQAMIDLARRKHPDLELKNWLVFGVPSRRSRAFRRP